MPRSFRAYSGALALLLGIVVASPTAAQDPQTAAQPDSAQLAGVLAMMDAMKLGDDLISMIETLMGDPADPNSMPEEYRQPFLRQARTRVPDLLQTIAPLYAVRLTPQDVADVTAFYRSPAAQHLMIATDAIDAETESAVERWSWKIVGEVMIELGNAPPATPPASSEN